MYKNIKDNIKSFRIQGFIIDGSILRDINLGVQPLDRRIYGSNFSSKRLLYYLSDKKSSRYYNISMGSAISAIESKGYQSIFNMTSFVGGLYFATADDMYNFIDYIIGYLMNDGYKIDIQY